MGIIFRLELTGWLAREHIRKYTILRRSIIFREMTNGRNNATSRQFEIAGPVDLISRLCTWLGNILFDVDPI